MKKNAISKKIGKSEKPDCDKKLGSSKLQESDKEKYLRIVI